MAKKGRRGLGAQPPTGGPGGQRPPWRGVRGAAPPGIVLDVWGLESAKKAVPEQQKTIYNPQKSIKLGRLVAFLQTH